MEVYLQVRRAHFDEGRSQRLIARDFGLARGTVRKMCAYPVLPGHQRSQDMRRPKLDGFTDKIDQWLSEDLDRPKKQRHTVKRIHERLREEEGFTGGYTTVKDYVRAHRRISREMFIPLEHVTFNQIHLTRSKLLFCSMFEPSNRYPLWLNTL